ncbi:MAG: hypothetical protein L3J51_09855 [Cocleimonas sp.]|nr:hypothetical protein [Cocleimonas sp.]
MKKALPIVVLFTAAVLTTMFLNGCGEKAVAVETPTQKHLSSFLSLHNQFCEKKYTSSDSLKVELAQAPTLNLAKDFDGVYEVLISNVSFAVSPEDDGCTTDVMLQVDGKQLFTFEDINKALLASGYIETGEPVSLKDTGIDQSELTIIEKKYISPTGEVTTLDFPLEKMDKYYMTLFTEKFTEAKQESKEQVIKSLRMASL